MPDRRYLSESEIRHILPERKPNSHKGENGYAVLFAGSEQYTGAALMSAAAALRAGCGVLTVGVPGKIKPAFAMLPEACCIPVSEDGEWDAAAQETAVSLLAGKKAAGMGCGMGRSDSTVLLDAFLRSGIPSVLDADGLNLLAKHPDEEALLHPNLVVTPHPGEMARLTGKAISAILEDPERTASEYAQRWNCVVLLKGAESCISDGKRSVWNRTGNAGLAKGGSGDVLTGLILGLLSQGVGPFEAACAGSFLLGSSAEKAYSLLGVRMLMASDVIEAVETTIGMICGES